MPVNLAKRIPRISVLELDQSRQDACDQSARGEGESSLSGLHIPLVSRPVWPRQTVSACGTVEEGLPQPFKGRLSSSISCGSAYGIDDCPSSLSAYPVPVAASQ